MARTHAPITSFGAELQAVLRKGADRHIEIKFPTKNLATRFKQRINALRAAMKKADHADWQNLYRCGVYEHPTDPCIVTLGPKDSEFRGALKAAGIDVDEPPPVSAVEVGESVPGSVDDFLSELTSATSVQKILGSDTDEEPPVDKL